MVNDCKPKNQSNGFTSILFSCTWRIEIRKPGGRIRQTRNVRKLTEITNKKSISYVLVVNL